MKFTVSLESAIHFVNVYNKLYGYDTEEPNEIMEKIVDAIADGKSEVELESYVFE